MVKNVAGLDMAKLMIGSFGTLAAIAVVNFKLAPRPPSRELSSFASEPRGCDRHKRSHHSGRFAALGP